MSREEGVVLIQEAEVLAFGYFLNLVIPVLI